MPKEEQTCPFPAASEAGPNAVDEEGVTSQECKNCILKCIWASTMLLQVRSPGQQERFHQKMQSSDTAIPTESEMLGEGARMLNEVSRCF